MFANFSRQSSLKAFRVHVIRSSSKSVLHCALCVRPAEGRLNAFYRAKSSCKIFSIKGDSINAITRHRCLAIQFLWTWMLWVFRSFWVKTNRLLEQKHCKCCDTRSRPDFALLVDLVALLCLFPHLEDLCDMFTTTSNAQSWRYAHNRDSILISLSACVVDFSSVLTQWLYTPFHWNPT